MKAAHEDLGALARVLGVRSRGMDGPLVVVVGGIHGNEPAGIEAAERVLARLDERELPLRGKLAFLVGNRAALAQGKRYLDADLNRLWTDAEVARLRSGGASDDVAESHEQRELLAELEGLLSERPWREVVLLDLHSTSAQGAPFTIMGDTLQNRVVAFAFPVPVLLGLEERVEGTLLAWFGSQGRVAVCLEGGQNESRSTVDHHEAAIWIALVAAGTLARSDVAEYDAHLERLARSAAGLPHVVEIRHRHPIVEGEPFEMRAGYANFSPVARGEALAFEGPDRAREVYALFEGLLLMPRYQGQGSDGFFLGREVRPFWLTLSAWFRRLRLSGLLAVLPGVARDEHRRDLLRVDRRIARWLSVEVFHLFGYRAAREEAGRLVFVRRPDRI